MEAISFLVLILLCLVGYSAGAVARAGKSVELRPLIVDLVLVSVIWAGAIYCRVALDLNRWLLVLGWLVLSSVVGILAIWPRELREENVSSAKAPEGTPNSLLKRLWQSWSNFSRRMGSFHGKIVLSLFFFTVVTPFATAVRVFSDPLRIRHRTEVTHWLPRTSTDVDLEQLRRQF
jgi:hypothetical protein